tara:strand:+ start:381 stop:629 length:249 start_codon:yes stop_codon:yes gene_type:complete
MDVTENQKVAAPAPSAENAAQGEQTQQIDLLSLEITNENVALNALVGFLNIAQRRGVFNFPESSKINECIQKFVRQSPPQSQ